MTATLPVDAALPELHSVLSGSRAAVLVAPPGAGKTTRVPLFLIDQEWMNGKMILMLEPRRLAARRAAEYMAGLLTERVGETVGYRIRGERKVSGTTRIEVVTEGILTRMLHDTPDLPGVGVVVFDEYHERSVHADLGLAFTLDSQEHLRPDLRILVMSATLDHVAVADLLGGAPVVRSEGRSYPVETRYARTPSTGYVEPVVSAAIVKALRETEGDILVFLPGQREIRRVDSLLQAKTLDRGIRVHLLFGDADPRLQQEALNPAPAGERKIILSTSIAETSLTIDGVRVVIDAGLSRLPKFEARRGMAGLVTVPASLASADQRRGRAGRQGPGVCYRLWTESQEVSLPRYTTPEILSTDLMPLALDLALWGDPYGEHLRFLDRPPAGHIAQARSVLTALGALARDGSLTDHGKAMSRLGVHPRIAHMIVQGSHLGRASQACRLAAILSERDVLRSQADRDIDLASRWNAINEGRGIDSTRRSRITTETQRLLRMVSGVATKEANDDLGILVALAYPDRIAMKKKGGEGYLLSNGTAGTLLPRSVLSQERLLAVAEVDGIGTTATILLAAPLEKAEIDAAFLDQFERTEETIWDEQAGAALLRKRLMLGALVFDETTAPATGDRARDALLAAIRNGGLRILPWSTAADSLVRRSEWLRTRGLVPEDWPRMEEALLLASLDQWLGPALDGMTRRSHLQRLDLLNILRGRFSYRQLNDLERLAPERIAVPSGSLVRIEYDPQNPPVLAVKLQEMFGQTSTPTAGSVPVMLHLLSPAGRPLAVTQDLPSFWKNVYPEVRKQMRGKYPKHPWPEDPLTAIPVRGVKRTS